MNEEIKNEVTIETETYEIKFACGHTQDVEISGVNGRERNAKSKELKLEDCEFCKEKAARWPRKKARLEAIQANFPPLTGSEKQIAWAEKIRLEMLCTSSDLVEADYQHTNAGWWIDVKQGRIDLNHFYSYKNENAKHVCEAISSPVGTPRFWAKIIVRNDILVREICEDYNFEKNEAGEWIREFDASEHEIASHIFFMLSYSIAVRQTKG